MIKDGKLQWRYVLALAVGIIVLWALSGFLIHRFVPEGSHGTFGDQFGAINALFSGFAFAGLIITLFMQRTELSMQREVLQMQRDEMRGTKEALEQQSKTLEQQRFESTFFNLIKAQNDFCAGTVIENGAHRLEWNSLLSHLYSSYGRKGETEMYQWKGNPLTKKAFVFFEKYINGYKYIFEFVNSSNLEDKGRYIELIRIQFLQHETFMIFIFSSFYDEEMFELLNKHEIAKYFNKDDVAYFPNSYKGTKK